jgi:hypothetical protein
MARCPSEDWDWYCREQEEVELAAAIDELRITLREMNEGRNLKRYDDDGRCLSGCFDLISFGWKDADLEPTGCTGIDSILGANDETVTVRVSGHKTLVDPTYECEWDLTAEDKSSYSMLALSVVCDVGCSGEWTGDDWCLFFSETVSVPWADTVKETAERVIEAAEKVIAPYETMWIEADEGIERLYCELRDKYRSV